MVHGGLASTSYLHVHVLRNIAIDPALIGKMREVALWNIYDNMNIFQQL